MEVDRSDDFPFQQKGDFQGVATANYLVKIIWDTNQLMVNCWFGSRWFGLLESPKMKGIGILRVYP